MRALLLALPLLPLPALADTITLPSAATAATIYSTGAQVTHAVTLDVPPGRHQIILPDLPPDLPLDFVRVAAPDLSLGALRYRSDLTPPRAHDDSPEIAAAKARIAQIEAEIDAVEDRAAREALAAEAAEAQIAFLQALGGSAALPSDPAVLRKIGSMIGSETLAARQKALDAERRVRETRRALEDLEEALEEAKRALAALVPEAETRPLLVLDVSAETPLTDAPLTITFPAAARWRPSYDLRLTLEPDPRLILARSARISQQSGENWQGVTLTLSTQQISGATDPSDLAPDLRRIEDETDLSRPSPRLSSALDDAPMPAPMAEAASVAGMQNVPQGLSVTYRWQDPVDVASGADELRLPFDTIALAADVVARAVPLHESTAFLVAKVTNDTGEPLLGSAEALRFVEGGLVGRGRLAPIQAGEEVEIGFGAIKGLQLTRRVLQRGEADRGILSRRGEITEELAITLKNLTARTWAVELRDRVPYSEQEDLVITYRATPEPEIEAVDDKRGVLEWRFDMAPGTERTVSTTHRITWPEGQILR